jgi:hypothetical protein
MSQSTPYHPFQFRREGNRAYPGERVVPFEIKRRSAEAYELRHFGPVTMASGRLKGLMMQDRQDARRARSRVVTRIPEPVDSHHEPSERLLEAWAPVEDRLRQAVDPGVFACWLADVHPHRLVKGEWYLACHPRKRDWILVRFRRLITECAGCPVVFVNCETNQRRTS